MNPALSVIAFTTLSGAGYGLMIWLGLLLPFHRQPPLPAGFGIWTLLLALVLVSAGLLASLAHLGHPERAWRAFSQWRTSWLSREGVLAVWTFVPALLTLLVLLGYLPPHWLLWLGPLLALSAALTVLCTAMIYASLKTVPHWRDWRVAPLYLLFALATGATFQLPVLNYFAPEFLLKMPTTTAQVALFVAFVLRYLQRRALRDSVSAPSLASAVGLPEGNAVKLFEGAHTEDSFITREMVFRFARKHREPMFLAALACGIALAGGLLEHASNAGPGIRPSFLFAALFAYAGVFFERWLFFAEARHVVSVYFERPDAGRG
ncbi:DMSO reductase [Ahniella affigens]|uniref:DMSO reductase n=1 Tax=Ahniella affigens TaxID=2021234 RepID=A0A2P1PWJ6_9GAMM|nr:DmsC/YnfH family molybdoenzyme membrane anchor subunit [Ahniella affigens]AVP99209.1 DMSO reductase [Ahniella affigens]